ncbi:MAG: DUF924 domain-containing protein [Rhizobiales bacterium]|nr:DUF924 domain-containing protein [Hyphomicrobiales bacterium]
MNNSMTLPPPRAIVDFWLAAGPEKWFNKDAGFDAEIRARFLAAQEAAARGELSAWEATPEGAIALLILLDQFSRNLYRGEARTFAADPMARGIADRAIARGDDMALGMPLRQFFYLPFMHSELLADQERSVALYRALGDADLQKFADEHADIIRRFGRFPHRNPVLGRATTPDEQAYLDAGGFAG